jgi:catechol 2,3-dioxygenase-like lactoylglutathione lyase family enzyme
MATPPRVQLALNVSDIDAAVDFYGRMFGAAPHKRRPGYANFALESPPLKLVLIENAASAGSLNHLGVEVPSTMDVADARNRLDAAALETRDEDDVVCCFARQDKVWVEDPDGASWEVYAITDDDPDPLSLSDAGPGCCAESVVADHACCAG